MTGSASRRCLNCEAELTGRYCAACGQDGHADRLGFGRLVRRALRETTEWEGPIVRTVRDLLWRPGHVASEYVAGRRRRYANPLKFCIIAAALVITIGALTGSNIDLNETIKGSDDPVGQQMQQHVVRAIEATLPYTGPITIAILPVLALLMRVLVWKGDRRLVEHYVMALYVYGQAMLLQLVVALALTPVSSGASLIGQQVVLFGLYSFAAVQFCRVRWYWSLPASLLAHLVFYVVFIFAVFGMIMAYLFIWVGPEALAAGASAGP